MKIALIIGILFLRGIASACPNLSGEYEFVKPATGTIVVKQSNCTSIQIHIVWNKYVASFVTDNKFYERKWDANGNSISNIPVSPNSNTFDRASYVGDRFVWNKYDGKLASCEGKYSYTSFECKLLEHSLGYNPNLKSYTWTSIAWWRGRDGRYAKDEYLLKKVR